jgi:hypothetical protein
VATSKNGEECGDRFRVVRRVLTDCIPRRACQPVSPTGRTHNRSA